MKKIFNIIWAISLMVLSSCSNDIEDIITPSTDEIVEVSLNFQGDFEATEYPLSRSFDSSKDYCAIQVWEGSIGNSEYYAFGLFSDITDMKINLHKNKSYSFKCIILKDAQGKVQTYYGDNNQEGLGAPFGVITRTSPTKYYYYKPSNKFNYSDNNHFRELDFGQMSREKNKVEKYPEIDWFYGQLSDYTPTQNGSASINMLRTAFGVRIEILGITDGSISYSLSNDVRTLLSESNISTDKIGDNHVFAFYDAKTAWQYPNTYSETVSLNITWTRGNGIIQDLGTKEIQVNRNVVNVIKVQLGANDNGATIGVTTEDDSNMESETVNLTLD